MKKFEELRRCLEKYSEVNLVNIDENGLVTEGAWFEPSLILDLLADREQLRNVIKKMTVDNCYDERIWDEAAEALKKSDEVENG